MTGFFYFLKDVLNNIKSVTYQNNCRLISVNKSKKLKNIYHYDNSKHYFERRTKEQHIWNFISL